MDPTELENWQKVKDHFDNLPEKKRDNWFYKRAIAILAGKKDPLK
jgi:hypothetical protein